MRRAVAASGSTALGGPADTGYAPADTRPAPTEAGPVRRRRRSPTQHVVAAFQTFPVSSMVAAPFLLIIFPSAVFSDSQDKAFLLGMFVLGVLPPFILELLIDLLRAALHLPVRAERVAASLRRAQGRRWGAVYWTGVGLVLVGGTANILRARAGVGTIQSQVGLADAGGGVLTSLLALFVSYDLLGVFILTWCFAARAVGRARWLVPVGLAAGMKLVYVGLTGITEPLFSFIIGFFVIGFFLSTIRVRWMVAGVIAVTLAWPTFYRLRNQARLERGVWVSQDVSAADRLALDRLVAAGHGIQPGQDIGQISPLGVFRYGLLPRILDTSRPSLDTGSLISEHLLGGSGDSSVTFLQVATPYVLYGAGATVLLLTVTAAAVALLVDAGRTLSIQAFLVMALVLSTALSWTGSYPDSFVGALQTIVAAAPVLVLLTVLRWWRAPGARDPVDRARRDELARIAALHR